MKNNSQLRGALWRPTHWQIAKFANLLIFLLIFLACSKDSETTILSSLNPILSSLKFKLKKASYSLMDKKEKYSKLKVKNRKTIPMLFYFSSARINKTL